MALSEIIALGINITAEATRQSSWKNVDVGYTNLIVPMLAIHDTLIDFDGIFIGLNETLKIKNVVMRQVATLGSGQALVTELMYLVLFDKDGVVPSFGTEITFPSTIDEDNVVAVIPIPIANWIEYKTGYSIAEVECDVIVKGNSTTPNINLHGVIIKGNVPLQFTDPNVVSIKLKTIIEGDANDA